MSDVEVITTPELRTARTGKPCTWCGQRINPGDKYTHQRVKVEGEMTTNNLHPECNEALDEAVAAEGGSVIFSPGGNERPSPPTVTPEPR